MSDNRATCPQCGEQVASTAQQCFRCEGSLLWSVVTVAPVADPKERFFLAKALLEAQPGASVGELQRALGAPGGQLTARATRAQADALLALLESRGVKAQAVPLAQTQPASGASSRAPAQRAGPRWLPTLGLAVLLAAAGLSLLARHGSHGLKDLLQDPAPAPSTPVSNTREIAARATSATAVLRCPHSLGTGFFVERERLVTNAHVLCQEGEPLSVELADGRHLLGDVLRRDDDLDLALVRVLGAAANPLPLGDASAVAAGDKVVMIGTPRGMEFTVHEGTISYNGRNHYGVAYLQFDANVNPGNSGGPLLDSAGRVVGVVSMMVTHSNGIGLALPVNYLTTGASALLAADGGPPPSGAWAELVARVAEVDRKSVEELATALQKPGLMAASPQGEGVAAVVVQRNPTGAPSEQRAHFELQENGRAICQADATLRSWRRVEERGAAPGASALMRWAWRNGVQKDLYSVVVELPLPGCRPGEGRHELVLEGADPQADRQLLPF